MKISIHAVGRLKAGPERQLVERYLERLKATGRPLGLEFAGVREIAESRAPDVATRKREESAELLGFCPAGCALVLLEERGQALSTREFADMLARLRDAGKAQAVIAIGGPDGHDGAARDAAIRTVCFGTMTWPHQLVRVMLAEQLYRVATVLAGHPYHRD